MKPIVSSTERLIGATAERVWDLVDDPGQMGEWFAFADRMELLDGEGVGRRQRLHGHWGRKRSEVDQQVVAYEPQRRLTWIHESERLDGRPAPRFAAETRFTVDLQPAGAGSTRVTLETRQVPAGVAKGLVLRISGTRDVRRLMRESLDRLVDQLDERDHPDRPG
jgi:uncharacterized protein YndB with AHSA1/START domain